MNHTMGDLLNGKKAEENKKTGLHNLHMSLHVQITGYITQCFSWPNLTTLETT